MMKSWRTASRPGTSQPPPCRSAYLVHDDGRHWTSREAADDFLDRYVSPTHMDVCGRRRLILLCARGDAPSHRWIMPVLSMMFFAYGLWGNYLPAPWTHKGYRSST